MPGYGPNQTSLPPVTLGAESYGNELADATPDEMAMLLEVKNRYQGIDFPGLVKVLQEFRKQKPQREPRVRPLTRSRRVPLSAAAPCPQRARRRILADHANHRLRFHPSPIPPRFCRWLLLLSWSWSTWGSRLRASGREARLLA